MLFAVLILSGILIYAIGTSNACQTAHVDGIPISEKASSASFPEAAVQTSNLNTIVLGFDYFIIGIYVMIIPFNLFYFFMQKKLSFLVYIMVCLIMIVRTMIYGSHSIYFFYPNISAMTLFYIDCITQFLLPSALIVVTYGSMPVKISKTAINLCFVFSIINSLLLFILPVSSAKWLIIISGAVLIFICIYLILIMVDSIIAHQMNTAAAILITAGIPILTACIASDIFQFTIIGRVTVGYIPTGFMILTLFWEYYYSYNYEQMMKDRLKVLEELSQVNEKERELELKFLKSQIRPHFIHNALNAIISVSLTDNERARLLLYEFSNYLRGCYDIGRLEDVMSIENELSFVQAYVALEQARFADNLNVEYNIDQIMIDIPPLTLQPLVENAITHNIINKEKPLNVLVYVIRQEGTVKIGVQDNGEGVDQEKVHSLLCGEQKNRGVGLANINERLIKLYGTELHVENRAEGGTDVFMLIPYNEETENTEI